MIDVDAFARQVRDVLAHLNDPAHLSNHPIAAALAASPGPPLAPDRLRRTVLDAIDELRPPVTADSTSASWREYRHLVLRYIEGQTAEDVARGLTISERQARRDHCLAMRAVTDALWQRRPDAQLAVQGDPVSTTDLESELLYLGRELPDESTSVAEAVRSALATTEALLHGARVACALALAEDLPPVTVSRSVLRQALVHLLSFGSDLSAGSRMLIGTAETDGVVSVRAEFHSGSSTRNALSAQAAASDLRLVAVERLVAMQGGTTQRASPRGGELIVTLRLPAVPLSTVLVVDDNPDFIRLFRRYTRGLPYRVIEANLGSEARRLALETRPAVITLDVMMAQQDGWEVLQSLKANPDTRDVPVVICSVTPESALARSLGAVEHLTKPVSQSDLLAMLARRCPTATAHRD